MLVGGYVRVTTCCSMITQMLSNLVCFSFPLSAPSRIVSEYMRCKNNPRHSKLGLGFVLCSRAVFVDVTPSVQAAYTPVP